jgi:putative SOS response-associated peptidase YedK
MCGRYTLTANPRDLEQRFGVTMPEAARGGRYNIAPTEDVLAVVGSRKGAAPEARIVRWGLWGKPVINARAETVLEKGGFRRLAELSSSRCLILADGFYEWLKPEDRRQPRQPFRFTVDDGAPFAMAGLCSRGTGTILTTAPNSLVARLHDRMPVVLPDAEAEAAWLADGVSAEEAVAACVPLDAGRMQSAPVSRRVNAVDPDDDGPHLLVAEAPEPDGDESAPRLFA